MLPQLVISHMAHSLAFTSQACKVFWQWCSILVHTHEHFGLRFELYPHTRDTPERNVGAGSWCTP